MLIKLLPIDRHFTWLNILKWFNHRARRNVLSAFLIRILKHVLLLFLLVPSIKVKSNKRCCNQYKYNDSSNGSPSLIYILTSKVIWLILNLALAHEISWVLKVTLIALWKHVAIEVVSDFVSFHFMIVSVAANLFTVLVTALFAVCAVISINVKELRV